MTVALFGGQTYPITHGLPVQHLLRYVVFYSTYPMRNGTPGTANWKHDDMSTHISGSTGVEFSLDILGQARDAVWVFSGAREAEAEW